MIIKIIKTGARHVNSGKELRLHEEIGVSGRFPDVMKWATQLIDKGYAIEVKNYRESFVDELEKEKKETTKRNINKAKLKNK